MSQPPQQIQQISIHAPMKGATVLDYSTVSHQWISIHAPMKGATLSDDWQLCDITDFNPRSHEGSDQPELPDWIDWPKFQSTLP